MHQQDKYTREMKKLSIHLCVFTLLINVLLIPYPLEANTVARSDSLISNIDDTPGPRDLEHPDWFTESFLDLREDFLEAKRQGKKGIIVYFGQTDCAYCQALLEINFERETDIVKYTQEHFNVIAIDIWGSREGVDMDGETFNEREFAEHQSVHFTPTLLFYIGDKTNHPKEILRLNGYYPPYEFRGALKYIVDGYYKKESLKEYMHRADPPGKFELGDINEEDFFISPPYVFDRRYFKASKPLAIFFEQKKCHACDILHTDPLNDAQVRKLLEGFEVAQLDIHADTPTITPSGERLTAKKWAKQLNIFYSPTLVFFDERGKEILRVDSVVRLYRLRGILDFITSKDYLTTPTFQRWRENIQEKGL